MFYHEGTIKQLHAQLGRADRIREYFDTVELTPSGSPYDFFPASATGGAEETNYTSMPLQGQLDRVLVAVSLESMLKFIKDDSGNSIDALQTANVLRWGTLKIFVDNKEKKLVDDPITKYWNPGQGVTANAGGDATAAAEEGVVGIESRGIVPLAHQIGVPTDQDVTPQVQLENDGNLPTSSNISSSSQGGDGLVARLGLQLVEGPSLIERLKRAQL
jgi:hypothetical protein